MSETTVKQPCKCDRGQHFNWKTKELGKKHWSSISKADLARLDLHAIEGKYNDLICFMSQLHSLHQKCIVDNNMGTRDHLPP